MEYISYRMDSLTRKRYPKDRLIRFVLVDGVLTIDEAMSTEGRGFYLLKENVRTYFEKGPGKKYLKKMDPEVWVRFTEDGQH